MLIYYILLYKICIFHAVNVFLNDCINQPILGDGRGWQRSLWVESPKLLVGFTHQPPTITQLTVFTHFGVGNLPKGIKGADFQQSRPVFFTISATAGHDQIDRKTKLQILQSNKYNILGSCIIDK